MKRSIPAAAFLSVLALACGPEPKEEVNPDDSPKEIAVEEVKVTPPELTLEMDQTFTLHVEVLPENATDKSVTFFSAKSGTASVSDDGTVTALMIGKTEIYVSAGDETAICKVNVVAKAVKARSVALDKAELLMLPGDNFSLEYSVEPMSIDETPVWKSDNEDVVTVDGEGKLNAVAPGTATVSVNFEGCSSECVISVKPYLAVKQVDALEKLLPGKEYNDNPDIIRVARGETATVQMSVEAGTKVSGLKAELVSFEGAITPRMYWERNITCTEHWDEWAGGRPSNPLLSKGNVYPDPLMPLDEWNVNLFKGDKNGLWIEFDIPRDFAPGTYKGELKVSGNGADGALSASKEFTVQVYPVQLPEKQGLTVIQWDGGSHKAMRGGQDDEYYAWNDYIRIIVRFMNDYCQNAWRLEYAMKSNMGGKCDADYTTDPPSIKYRFDSMWTREFEMFIEECPDLRQIHGHQIGMRQTEEQIEEDGPGRLVLGGYYLNYDKLDGQGRPTLDYYYGYDNDEQALEVTREWFRQLSAFLKSHEMGDGRTWFDLYVQTIMDEPKDEYAEAYTNIARAIKEAAPDMKITDAIETDKIDPRYLDYPCPTLSAIENNRAAEGQTQWVYNCMSPQGDYANRFIMLPLVKTRIIHWCNYHYNAVGYLHWGLKYWDGVSDPYGDAYGQFIGGDSFIVYPGDNKLYPSIRLCAMRDGIRDYDLLRMVEARDKAAADDFCHRIILGPADYDLDLGDFRQVRKEILEYLSN